MGNGRDSVENASVSAFHNVNLCMGLGLLLLRLAVIQTGLAVQTGLAITWACCHSDWACCSNRACHSNQACHSNRACCTQTGLARRENRVRYNVLLFLYKTILQVMYLLPT